MRQLYLAATGMNRGKTTVSLGLMAALQDRHHDIGFVKPVGQRYAIVDGQPADEDAILMRAAVGLSDPLSMMSPVHIPRGFTKSYIRGDVTPDLPGRIRRAHASLAATHDLLLIEGTGHAGVGSVVGLSNANVARMLRAPALIVSEGGVGRPIDEIVLNRALFARHGVEVVGAIVNKVDADAQPDLPDILREGLAKHGIPLLGMLPYRPLLSNPTLSMLVEQVKGELLSQGEDLDRVIEHVAIGAMQPRHLIDRVGPGSLLIVPGDRTDVIHAMVAANRASRLGGSSRGGLFQRRRQVFGRAPEEAAKTELAGLVLTGGYRPRPRDLEAIQQERLFAFLVEEDTYEAASEVHDLLVKTHPADRGKIELTRRLVSEHLDIDAILERFADPAGVRSPRGPAATVTKPAGQFARLVGSGLRSITGSAGRLAGSRSGARKET